MFAGRPAWCSASLPLTLLLAAAVTACSSDGGTKGGGGSVGGSAGDTGSAGNKSGGAGGVGSAVQGADGNAGAGAGGAAGDSAGTAGNGGDEIRMGASITLGAGCPDGGFQYDVPPGDARAVSATGATATVVADQQLTGIGSVTTKCEWTNPFLQIALGTAQNTLSIQGQVMLSNGAPTAMSFLFGSSDTSEDYVGVIDVNPIEFDRDAGTFLIELSGDIAGQTSGTQCKLEPSYWYGENCR